jgi:zinc protease
MTLNRSIKPQPKTEITFHLPQINKFKLENGLQVLFVKKEALPIIQLSLVVDAGSKYDPENMKGLSNLSAMMIDEGAGKFNALELSDEFDSLGSNFRIRSDEDSIFLSMLSLKDNFARSLDLYSSIITEPHFDESNFPREKRKILTRLLQVKDNPDEIANIVFGYLVFSKSNPYAFPSIGVEEDILKITNDDTKQFYKDYIVPNNAALVVVGDADKNDIEESFNKLFTYWKPKQGLSLNKDDSIKTGKVPFKQRDKNGKIFFVHKDDAAQSEIRAGHLTSKRNSKDYFAKTILNTIFGGQFSSRINLNLRERKGYTYGAYSRYNYHKHDAYFYISTSVSSENTANTIKEILYELDKIREGVTKEELEFAKSSLIRKFPSRFETYMQEASNLVNLVIYSLPDNYYNTYIDELKDVSLEDVKKAAAANIHPNDLIFTVVGNREKIFNQLSDAGFGDMVEVDHFADRIITP